MSRLTGGQARVKGGQRRVRSSELDLDSGQAQQRDAFGGGVGRRDGLAVAVCGLTIVLGGAGGGEARAGEKWRGPQFRRDRPLEQQARLVWKLLLHVRDMGLEPIRIDRAGEQRKRGTMPRAIEVVRWTVAAYLPAAPLEQARRSQALIEPRIDRVEDERRQRAPPDLGGSHDRRSPGTSHTIEIELELPDIGDGAHPRRRRIAPAQRVLAQPIHDPGGLGGALDCHGKGNKRSKAPPMVSGDWHCTGTGALQWRKTRPR